MMKPIQLFVIAALGFAMAMPVYAQSELANQELQPVRWVGNQVVYLMQLPPEMSPSTTKSVLAELSIRKGIELKDYNEAKGNLHFAASRSFELKTFADLDKYLSVPQPPSYFLEGSSSKLYSYVSESVPSHILSRIKSMKVMSITAYQALNEADRRYIDQHEDLYFVSSNMSLAGACEELVEDLLTK